MPKLKYKPILEYLQKLTNKEFSHSTLSELFLKNGINVTGNALSNRLSKDGYLNEKEIEIIEKEFDINLFKINTKIDDNSDCIDLVVRGNISASMGYGIEVYDESQTGICSISRKFLKDIGANINKTEIILASGDSMEPTIQGGDRLFVDLSRKNIHDGKIYCIRYEGELYAKRLQKTPPSTINVISDNQKYKSWEIDFSKEINFDFEIIGEILYWGRIAR